MKEGNHIALVANSTWNIYNFRLNLVDKLIEQGHKVTIIAPVDEYIVYKDRYPIVHHISLKNLSRNNTNPLKDILLINELRRIYRRIRPDLIVHYTHKPNIFGGMAARIAGVPSVAVVTGLGYAFLHKGPVNTIIKKLYAVVNRFHRKVIFENEDDLALFIQKKLVRTTRGVAVHGCGVDTSRFTPHPNGLAKDRKVFTFIGRLLYDKGIVEFVTAAQNIRKKHPGAEFWVIGELDEGNPSMVSKEQLIDWIDGGDIIYYGFQKDVRDFITRSNCIVLPSYREGMPRIVLEGMAMGRPVITTRTAGCRQTVMHGQNGYLVNIADAEDLVEKIEDFLQLSHEQQVEMGLVGRQFAESSFEAGKVASEIYKIIKEVLIRSQS